MTYELVVEMSKVYGGEKFDVNRVVADELVLAKAYNKFSKFLANAIVSNDDDQLY